MTSLICAVSSDLVMRGWARRALHPYGLAVFTRDTGNGVMVTAELGGSAAGRGQQWPLDLVLDVGVGYEPALNLMPLLTMDTHVTLLPDYTPPATSTYTTTIGDAGEVAAAADRIIGVIIEHAIGVVQWFPDADTIERAIPQRRPVTDGSGGDEPDPRVGPHFNYDRLTQLRLVLLAAAGRHNDARTLLSAYPSHHDGKPTSRDDRRFIRQLTRWLDDGGPAAPPIADTLAQLPPDTDTSSSGGSGSSSQATQDRSKQLRDVRDAVQARIIGKSVKEITAILTAEYAQRYLDASTTELALAAQSLHLLQQPFGRARVVLKALNMLRANTSNTLRLFTNEPDTVPAWLQPPERASYPVNSAVNGYTTITLDLDAHAWLTSAWTAIPRRVGPIATVDVWLTRDTQTTELIAHVGERRVGTIPANHADAYIPSLHAAALLDEDPVTGANLTKLDETGKLLLEIPTPHQ